MRDADLRIRRNVERASAQIHATTTREEAVRLRRYRSHAGHEPFARSRIASAFPLCEPRAGHRSPVRTETEPRIVAIRVDRRTRAGLGQLAAGLNGPQRPRGIDLLAHEVTYA